MIRELHKKIQNQEISAVELIEKHLAVIKEKDGLEGLNAFVTVAKEHAIAQAYAVDKKVKNGEKIELLAGIPYGAKDAICIKGIRTTGASKILDNYIAPYSATVIEKLDSGKAVMIGKTNMDELAMGGSTENSAYGRTKHPLDTSRVPGGSSGGSAAAVISDEVVWALGSDTGGSIRQPASFCGCVGLKPTYGRVSRHGLIAMASSLEQIGPLTHTVEDAAIVLSQIAGEDKYDATSAQSSGKKYEKYLTGDVTGKKIGILPKEFYKDLDPEILEKITQAEKFLKDKGAILEEIELPYIKYALSVYYIIMPSEVSSNIARLDGIRYGMSEDTGNSVNDRYCDTRQKYLGEEVKRRVMLGTYGLSAGYYDQYYTKAQKVRRLIREDFEKVFEKIDTILMPTTPEVAFKAGSKTDDPLTMYLSDIFTVAINLAGVPAISVPIGTIVTEGVDLPVGGQLIGKWFDEEGLLNIANVMEKIHKPL